MYEALFIGPLLILFLILVYHSLKIDGKRATIIFLGLGFIFALLRELIIGLTYPLYSGQFRIGPISPAIVFGWIFAFYLANYFARKITVNTKVESHLLVKVCLGTFVVLGISLVMETTAPVLGWWQWKAGLLESLPPGSLFLGAPSFVFIGWTITGVTFLTIYYLLQESKFKPKAIVASLVIYTVFIVNFVVGNYFILYNPSIQFSLFYDLNFTLSLLILLSIYIKKKYSVSLYENIFLFLLYIFYEVQLITGILVFTLNPFDLVYQIIFGSISTLYFGIILLLIRKLYPIIIKNL